MTNAMSHVNGFRLKDKIISQLRSKYSSKPLIIPAQHCNHDLFSQGEVPFVEMAKCRNGKMSKNYNYSLFYYFLL